MVHDSNNLGKDGAIQNAKDKKLGLRYTWTAAVGWAYDAIGDRMAILNGEDHTPFDLTIPRTTSAVSKRSSTLQGVCPNGWVLPSDYDWGILEKEFAKNSKKYVIAADATISEMNEIAWDPTWDYTDNLWRPFVFAGSPGDPGSDWNGWAALDNKGWGRAMKSPDYIYSSGGHTVKGSSKPAEEGGFNIVNSSYNNQPMFGPSAFWSTTTTDGRDAWARKFYSNTGSVQRYNFQKPYGFSVRCKLPE